MSDEHFPHFPDCCRPVLHALEEQQKTGSRNCPKGHALNLKRAYQIEAEMVAKEKLAAEKEQAEQAKAS